MAVSNTDYKKDHVYVGLGDYEISFDFDVDSSVVVVWTSAAGVVSAPKVDGVDYSIVSVGANSYIRVLIDFGAGGILTAYRDMPLTQTYTWVDGTEPAPSAIMAAIDRIVWIIQQVNGSIVNALKAPATEAVDMTIPAIAARALGFLAFDAAGLPIAAAGTPTVPVSSYVTPGLTVANATAWYAYFAIDDLAAKTVAADDDIFHLQDNAGVDKKIDANDLAETLSSRHTRKEALRNSKYAGATPFSAFHTTTMVDEAFVWQNNIVNCTNILGYAGNMGKFSIADGGFWKFLATTSGVYAYPPGSQQRLADNFPAAVASDTIQGGAFSHDGQYGVLYIDRSGTTRFTFSSDYGNTWSAYAATTGITDIESQYTPPCYNNNYFYATDATNDRFWRASKAAPGTFTQITSSLDGVSGQSAVHLVNSKIIFLKGQQFSSPTEDIWSWVPLTDDVTAGAAISLTYDGLTTAMARFMLYISTGAYPGYYALYPGSSPTIERLVYSADLSSLGIVDLDASGLNPLGEQGAAFYDEDLDSVVFFGQMGWSYTDGPIIRAADLSSSRVYRCQPATDLSVGFLERAVAIKENGALSSVAFGLRLSTTSGRRVEIYKNDEVEAIIDGDVVLI